MRQQQANMSTDNLFRFLIYSTCLIFLTTWPASATTTITTLPPTAPPTTTTAAPTTTAVPTTVPGATTTVAPAAPTTTASAGATSTAAAAPTTTAAGGGGAPTTTVVATTTAAPIECKNGTCSGNVSCITNDIASTCTLTSGQFCYQDVTTVSDNSVAPTYAVGCKPSCEYLVQTGDNTTVVTTTETFCCNTHLCNDVQLYPPLNSAVMAVASTTMLTVASCIYLMFT